MVELETEEVNKADTDSPTHLGPVELVFENNSVNNAAVQMETAAPGNLVLGNGVAQETGETPGGAGDICIGRDGVRGRF